MVLKTAYELALERLAQRESDSAIDDAAPIAKPEESHTIEGLLDDGTQLEQFAQGYVAVNAPFDPAAARVIVVIDPSLYNGIDSVLFRPGCGASFASGSWSDLSSELRASNEQGQLVQGYVVPTFALRPFADQILARVPCSTPADTLETFEGTLRNMVLGRSRTPVVAERFAALAQEAGSANTFVPVFKTRAAECYHHAAILAAMLRLEGVPARIVQYDAVDEPTWTRICDTLGRFKAEVPEQFAAKGILPEYFFRALKRMHPQLNGDLRNDAPIIGTYLSGDALLELDPADTSFRLSWNHVWVEAKIGGAWTTHDTTRLHRAAYPDPVYDAVFAQMQPRRRIVPEIRIMDKAPQAYFKDPANW